MSGQLYRIPVNNVPERFAIDLDGNALILILRWNEEMNAWTLDVYDEITGEPLILCLPVVAGVNLLEQFDHLLPGKMAVGVAGDEHADPTLQNIGREAELYYEAVECLDNLFDIAN